METLAANLQDKVAEILDPHFSRHPIAYNHYLTDIVQKVQDHRYLKAVEASLRGYFAAFDASSRVDKDCVDFAAIANTVAKRAERDMERVASSQAVDYMEAYYKVALKRTIDDVGVLAVEEYLLQKLLTLFTADTVYDFQDARVCGLAGESEETVVERTRLLQKVKVLQDGLHSLKRLDKHGTGHPQWRLDRQIAATSVPAPAGSGVATAMDDGQSSQTESTFGETTDSE